VQFLLNYGSVMCPPVENWMIKSFQENFVHIFVTHWGLHATEACIISIVYFNFFI